MPRRARASGLELEHSEISNEVCPGAPGEIIALLFYFSGGLARAAIGASRPRARVDGVPSGGVRGTIGLLKTDNGGAKRVRGAHRGGDGAHRGGNPSSQGHGGQGQRAA